MVKSMKIDNRNDAANPLEPGNALKDKNFSKATFRTLLITVALILALALIAFLFFANR